MNDGQSGGNKLFRFPVSWSQLVIVQFVVQRNVGIKKRERIHLPNNTNIELNEINN